MATHTDRVTEDDMQGGMSLGSQARQYMSETAPRHNQAGGNLLGRVPLHTQVADTIPGRTMSYPVAEGTTSIQ